MASRKKVKFSNGKKAINVALLAVALVGVLASTWLYQRKITTESNAAGGSTAFAFNPSSVKLKPVGEQMSLNIVINTHQDTVAAAVVDITYDSTVFEQVSIVKGTVLPVELLPQESSSGRISITLGAEPDAPFKGVGVVGTLKLKVKKTKESTVQFSGRTVASAIGKSGNVVTSRGKAEFFIETTPTPTPTVSGCFPSPTCQPPSGGCHYEIKNCKCVKVCSPTPTITVTKTPTPTLTATPTPTPSVTPPEGYNWFQEAVWYWAMERWGRIPAQIEWFFE